MRKNFLISLRWVWMPFIQFQQSMDMVWQTCWMSLVAVLPEVEETLLPENTIRVAIVGRPNVGKSSLVNRLLDSTRCIVSDIPGTTRDAIDTILKEGDKNFLLVDTAGIKRKGRTQQVLDKFSVIMALKAWIVVI